MLSKISEFNCCNGSTHQKFDKSLVTPDLETRQIRKMEGWFVEQKKDYDRAAASTPLASRLILRRNEERELRIRGIDRAGLEYYSNIVPLKTYLI